MSIRTAYQVATRCVSLTTIVIGLASFLPPTGSAESLTGAGEWQSLRGDAIKGTWSATLTRDGEALSGTFDLKGSNVLDGGAVTGSMDSSRVVLGLAEDSPSRITFTGKVEGDAVSGEWEYPFLGDHGVWYGSLSSLPKED